MLRILNNPAVAFFISPIPVVISIILMERGFSFGVMEILAKEMPFVYFVMLIFGWPCSLLLKKIGCKGYWCASIFISTIIFVVILLITYISLTTNGIKEVIYGVVVVVRAGELTIEGIYYMLVHSVQQAIAAGVVTFLFKFLTRPSKKETMGDQTGEM